MEASVCRELDQPPPLVHFWLQPCMSHAQHMTNFRYIPQKINSFLSQSNTLVLRDVK